MGIIFSQRSTSETLILKLLENKQEKNVYLEKLKDCTTNITPLYQDYNEYERKFYETRKDINLKNLITES